jgi:hypothetical protein
VIFSGAVLYSACAGCIKYGVFMPLLSTLWIPIAMMMIMMFCFHLSITKPFVADPYVRIMFSINNVIIYLNIMIVIDPSKRNFGFYPVAVSLA